MDFFVYNEPKKGLMQFSWAVHNQFFNKYIWLLITMIPSKVHKSTSTIQNDSNSREFYFIFSNKKVGHTTGHTVSIISSHVLVIINANECNL